jgi:hypothetical protein
MYGGHNIRFGHDGADVIKSGSGSDAILGDNGEIVRVRTGL